MKYQAQYGKNYGGNHSHYKHRLNTFKESLSKIDSHAAQNASFELGVNSFSDMTDEEFLERYENKALQES